MLTQIDCDVLAVCLLLLTRWQLFANAHQSQGDCSQSELEHDCLDTGDLYDLQYPQGGACSNSGQPPARCNYLQSVATGNHWFFLVTMMFSSHFYSSATEPLVSIHTMQTVFLLLLFLTSSSTYWNSVWHLASEVKPAVQWSITLDQQQPDGNILHQGEKQALFRPVMCLAG